MHSSLKMALYSTNTEGQRETLTELEDYLSQGRNPNARDASSTSLLELCIDFHGKFDTLPHIVILMSSVKYVFFHR